MPCSKMTKKQMIDLITFIQAKGDEWGIRWTDPAIAIETGTAETRSRLGAQA